jgi:hypothetical protein
METLSPEWELIEARNRFSETYSKLAQTIKVLEWRDQEIATLKEQVKNWKQRYIGVCLASWDEVDEDEADSFADTIKEMEC